jgi:hypothetical protein
MIIRRERTTFFCIRQEDHARLAADLMSQWRADGFPDNPRRDQILRATREHDGGWIEEDAATHVDSSGEPLDFVAVPPTVKQRIWPRGADRLAAASPYEAALVAEHALTVHGQLRQDPMWGLFFRSMEKIKADLLSRSGDLASHLDEDYRVVQTGDQLSLIFCNGWTAPFPRQGGRAVLVGSTLEISPDPFGGVEVPLGVVGRRIPARSYASATDLRNTLAAAGEEVLEGIAVGRV